MKKLIFILVFLPACLMACSKPVHTEQNSIPSDSLLVHVMSAIIDTNRSFLDVKDEFQMLIDTMKYHAEFCPDESTRIRAKGIAMTLGSLILEGDSLFHFTPEEYQYFLDSLVLPLDEVKNVWYYESDASLGGPMLCQEVIYTEYEKNLTTHIEVYMRPQGDAIGFYYPTNARKATIIAFSKNESLLNIDLAFSQEDAIYAGEYCQEHPLEVAWGAEVVDAMLHNDAMFFDYIDEFFDGTNYEASCKHHMLLLNKFQEKYQLVKSLLDK